MSMISDEDAARYAAQQQAGFQGQQQPFQQPMQGQWGFNQPFQFQPYQQQLQQQMQAYGNRFGQDAFNQPPPNGVMGPPQQPLKAPPQRAPITKPPPAVMQRISPGVYQNAAGQRVAPRGGVMPRPTQPQGILSAPPKMK